MYVYVYILNTKYLICFLKTFISCLNLIIICKLTRYMYVLFCRRIYNFYNFTV